MPVCAHCGRPFPNVAVIDGEPRVLSSRRYRLACSPFGSRNTRQLESGRVPKADRPREHCGINTRNPKYCSNKCQRQRGWAAVKRAVAAAGAVPAGNGARIAKRYLLEVSGRVCSVCGGSEWRGQPMPLVLDHVDGNADNWRLDNLRLVCGNCDMQLPTYQSKKRGNGRAWRRARYAAGKTY